MIAFDLHVSKNRIIRTLGLSKGTLYYQTKGYPVSRRSKLTRDPEAVKAIRTICKEEPTYGSPRVKAILKRDHGIELTQYMTTTIMREEGLLIERAKSPRASREHTGRIAVSAPNTRWASDITSIKCWDGTKIRVAIVMDCCDRTIIGWKIGRTMQASDLELLLQDCLLKRFGGDVPDGKGLEFLHDNGPEYIEGVFQISLKGWNVVDCRTPTYSPQSNGMCESFNWTFKRDYVYQSCLDDYETVEKQIGRWFRKYNFYAPHSSLGMMSPQKYYEERIAS